MLLETLVFLCAVVMFVFVSCISCVNNIYRIIPLGALQKVEQKYYLSVALVVTTPPETDEDEFESISGTAFAIDNDYLMTAGHVCKKAKELYILKKAGEKLLLVQANPDGTHSEDEIFADIIAIDSEKDMCLLRSEHHPFLPLTLALSLDELETEDPVIVVGAPMGMFPSRVNGYIMQVRAANYFDEMPYAEMILVRINILPGNSGSPLIWNGQLIGMTVITLPSVHDTALAVPIDQISEFIEQYAK